MNTPFPYNLHKLSNEQVMRILGVKGLSNSAIKNSQPSKNIKKKQQQWVHAYCYLC